MQQNNIRRVNQHSQTKNWTNGFGNITEDHLMDKISRMFHTFPLEFQQSYRLQLEYPISVDDYLPSGDQKEKRPDSLLYSPSNVFISDFVGLLSS